MNIRRLKITFDLLLILPFFLAGCNGKLVAMPTTQNSTQKTEQPTTSPITTISPTLTLEPNSQKSDAPCILMFSQITETGPEIIGGNCTTEPPTFFQITVTSGAALIPHWSPNLRYTAFLNYDYQTELGNFWVIDNYNDGIPRPVSADEISILGDYSWSSDSRYLVYSGPQSDGSEMDVFRIDIETGEIVNLTEDSPVWDAFPRSSPNGDQVAFVSDRHEIGKLSDNIWIMSLDGSELRNLTNTEFWEDVAPSWSPDGSEIAFFRRGLVMVDEERGPSGLWVVNLDTGDERLIIPLDEAFYVLGSNAPTWSPDGKYIAYPYGVPEKDAYVVSVDSGATINVSDLPGDEFGLSWSPDSKLLMFTYESQSDDQDWQLYIVEPDGANLEPLFDFGGNLYGEWAPTQNNPS